MKIEPVEQLSPPDYPDKYAEETKQALSAARPARWLAAPLVVGLLSATVTIGLSGCDDYVTMGDPTTVTNAATAAIMHSLSEIAQTEATSVTVTKPSTKAQTEKPATTTKKPTKASGTEPIGVTLKKSFVLPQKIVPLFLYGEGTGSFGCVSVAAPYFMSEDEAFAILAAAFAETGVKLSADTKAQKAKLPVTYQYDFEGKKTGKTAKGSLQPDGQLNGIPIEFVSLDDIKSWEKKNQDQYVTVSSYNTKTAAQTLGENNPGLVVFYDPVSYWTAYDESWSSQFYKTEEEARAASEAKLRQQVQAFVKWINTGGKG